MEYKLGGCTADMPKKGRNHPVLWLLFTNTFLALSPVSVADPEEHSNESLISLGADYVE